MCAARDFWRLLGDYERLTLDESALLGAGDFTRVAAIQSQKDSVLATLRTLAGEAGLDRSNEELARRMDAVIASAQKNKKLVDTMLRRARVERDNIQAARIRLHSMNGAYHAVAPTREAFCARV